MTYLQRTLMMGALFEDEPDAGAGGGGEDTPAPLLNDALEFSEGYQDRVGEHAAGATFKNLPDVFKSVREGTAALTKANTEKAELAKELEGLKGAPPKTYADAPSFKTDVLLPKELPDGVTIPDAVVDAAVTFAMEKGHPPSVVADFLAFQAQAAGAELAAINTEQFTLAQAAKQEIQRLVGAENYDTTIADAKATVGTLGLPIDEASLIANPSLVVTMSKLARSLEPGTLQSVGLTNTDNKAGALSKLSQAEAIITDENHPLNAAFYNPAHPRHDEAVATHSQLIAESGQ